MKKTLLTFILFTITSLGYSQGAKKQSQTPPTISISNLKLGLSEKYILDKYGSPKSDTTTNSTRRIVYYKIKLDNNYEIADPMFVFFKSKLIQLGFVSTDDIHKGLVAKYGYMEADEGNGAYGNSYVKNIQLGRIYSDDSDIIYLMDKKQTKLSESEGF
jgi:hypothetical protein